MSSFNGYSYYPNSVDEEAEAQRSQLVCPRSHNQLGAEVDSHLGNLTTKMGF